MSYIKQIEEALEKANKYQEALGEAWRSSKPSLIEVYDKRTTHCISIASAYIELEKMLKDK